MTTGECTASGLRQVAAPFVVAPPTGVRTRTRVRPTAAEDAALERIGVFLGGVPPSPGLTGACGSSRCA